MGVPAKLANLKQAVFEAEKAAVDMWAPNKGMENLGVGCES